MKPEQFKKLLVHRHDCFLAKHQHYFEKKQRQLIDHLINQIYMDYVNPSNSSELKEGAE